MNDDREMTRGEKLLLSAMSLKNNEERLVWFDNLSAEDKHELMLIMQESIQKITEAWKLLTEAVLSVVEVIGQTWDKFPLIYPFGGRGIVPREKKAFMTEAEVNEIFPEVIRHD